MDKDWTNQLLDERYRVDRLLGTGGMGAVYLGEQLVVGRKVAIKFLRRTHAQNKEILERFFREARTAAAIHSPYIIDVIDVGVSDHGDPFIIMEHLEGESLSELLRRTGPIDLAAACGILEHTLLAVAAAHAKGIVHRDLKPENIFITQQEGGIAIVKLIDFGVAKIIGHDERERLTQTGMLLGTPIFMSPEQARGATDVDHRSDIYALGVVLYEMLTGQLPFDGANYHEVLAQVLTSEPRHPADVYPGFPEQAGPIIKRAMAHNPADRYQSADEMLQAIKATAAFEQRQDSLYLLVSGILNASIASGDLGPMGSNDGLASESAREVLQRIVREGTPSISGSSRPLRVRLAVILLLFGVLVLAVSGLLVGFASRVPTPDAGSTPARTVVENSAAPTVRIAVEDLPFGARIRYNGYDVDQNPFFVERSATLSTILVEAEGFEPLRVAVAPLIDRVIRARMVAATAHHVADAGAPVPAGPRSKVAPSSKLSDSQGEQRDASRKFSRTRKGAEIAEEFR